MRILYSVMIHAYGFTIRLAALFNEKAALWVRGRRRIFERIGTALQESRDQRGQRKLAWFHCASLGEFEQGRPLIEKFRNQYPDYQVLLTFFSPSGYEYRKAYPGADFIFYLPLDTPSNARKFIDLVRPDLVFFIKYEFWFNYLAILQRRGIPHFLVSAIFRADQHFFQWYGNWPRKILSGFTQIFVQNNGSKELLGFIGITNVSVAGDTRFDRVAEIASTTRDIPMISLFTEDMPVLVAGSTWPADEALLVRYLKERTGKMKLILVPHEIRENAIRGLLNELGPTAQRYSALSLESAQGGKVLIIDSVGMLSQLYRYGTIAYVGGGFGAGIHNVLEAAVYGMPVIFGPNYINFHEAVELVAHHGGYPVDQYKDLEKILDLFLMNPSRLTEASVASKEFVNSRTGATSAILQEISGDIH